MRKKILHLFPILLVFIVFSCDTEPLEGEFSSTPDGTDPEEFCANAGLAIADAQLAFLNASETNAAALCENLRNTIESVITNCGDPGGMLQTVLDEIGNDCSNVTGSTGNNDDDDDDNSGGDVTCEPFINQDAQGSFRGVDFVNQGGSHRLQQNDTYFCTILVTEVIDGDCFFPVFGGNEGSILFSLPNLEPQTITLSDVVGEGESLNFNTINGTTTTVEQAVCGELEVLSSTDTMVMGRVTAIGQQGSTINGNFTLMLCE